MSDGLEGRRVSIYARYSSDRQREASIEDQIRRARQFIEARGGVVDPTLVFTDYAISGASLQRPGFEALLRLVEERPRKVDVIVVEDLSRLSRDFADAAQLFKVMRYAQVRMLGIGDGIDTDARSSKLTYGIKALIADLYRDDLADKTRRGLEGRVLAGFSAGGLAYGYRSIRVTTEDDREIGHRLELNAETAPIVRRIFQAYLDGASLGGIARQLLADGVPPPRARTRHRRKGWCASSIRAILHNERYTGVWTYGKKEWVRSPDSGKRRAREQDVTKVIQRDRPDLRIVEPEVWAAVQARLKGVHQKYTRREDGTPKGRGIPGKPARYLLSGLLACGQCGAPLSVFGSDPRYRAFRCTDHTRRGTCASRVALREAEGRVVILNAIVKLLTMPAPAAHLRKRAAQRRAELEAQRGGGTTPRASRLDDLNRQIANLVGVLAAGNTSEAIVTALRELEAQAAVERAREEARQVRAPVVPDQPRLPTPDEVVAAVQDLQALVDTDVSAAREALRRYLAGGRLVVDQTSDGHIVVRGDVLPVGYTEPPNGDSTWTGSVATSCSEESVATSGSGGGLCVQERLERAVLMELFFGDLPRLAA